MENNLLICVSMVNELPVFSALKKLCHKIPASPLPADRRYALERDVVNGAAMFVISLARVLAVSGG